MATRIRSCQPHRWRVTGTLVIGRHLSFLVRHVATEETGAGKEE